MTVVRGDLIQDRGARQRIVFESEEPITGIDFREDNTTALYISTTARILILVISGRGQGQPARTLDDTGCDVGCMTADESTGDVVVARDDAIYHYGLHGRGSCYNCDGHKTLLKTHKDYVVLAYPSSSSSLSQSMLGGLGLKGRSGSPDQSSTLTILNTDFHFVAHTESIAHSIQHYFSIMGDIIIVTAEGKVGSHLMALVIRTDNLRSCAIGKNYLTNGSICSFRGICLFLLFKSRREQVSTPVIRIPYFVDTVTTCTRRRTMTLLCSSI